MKKKNYPKQYLIIYINKNKFLIVITAKKKIIIIFWLNYVFSVPYILTLVALH